MFTVLRQFRSLKRQFVILCLLIAAIIWFHFTTSIQIIGGIYQTGKVSARLGVVYEWMKHDRLEDNTQPRPFPTAMHLPDPRNLAQTSKIALQLSRNRSATSPIESHPFDNLCQYPVLNPEDENLNHVFKHTRVHVCKKVQPEILTFDYDRGHLIFNRTLAEEAFAGRKPRCQYRPFSGGIRPRITDIVPIDNWIDVIATETPIKFDLIETKCFAKSISAPAITSNSTKNSTANSKAKADQIKEVEIYRFAFGHIFKRTETAGKNPRPYIKNDENTLSIDFLFLDSTAYNMMRRQMPKTWRYMKEVMGFYHLEGYTKVGDNSMVNLMPILAGLRYGTQAPDMPTEVPDDKPIDVEPIPFLWKFFRERGCATMFNDDIADYTRGFLNYPWTHVKGFAEIPTDHFIRPWHIFHRRYPISGSSQFCFGNYPYPRLQFNFLEQMIKKYRDTCHFSFNFITDLPHDDPNNLELADEDLFELLKRLYTGNYLNNTILFVMGDHGNRIGYIMYTYIGRIEERMTLFSVYIPEWYRRKYPEAMRQLELNKHRLTSNYDVHRMIREIFGNTLSKSEDDPVDPKMAVSKGVSLFRPIPANRTCTDANIPPPHCVCLEPVPKWSDTANLASNHSLYKLTKDFLLNWTRLQLVLAGNSKCDKIDKIEIVSIRTVTTSAMIQHGVRDMTPEQTEKLRKRIDGDIEYVDVIYKMHPVDFVARTRLQYYKKPKKKIIMNVEPRPFFRDSIPDAHLNSTLGHPLNNCNSTNETMAAPKKTTGPPKLNIPWFCHCQSK